MKILATGLARQAPVRRAAYDPSNDPVMYTFRRLLLWLVFTACSLSHPILIQGQALPNHEEKKTDKEQMLQIWKALMAYNEAKGKLPDFLSDLVPEYLPDKKVLVSPTTPEMEVHAAGLFSDPKLPCSYMYMFTTAKIPGKEETVRDMIVAMMEEYGPVVPILQHLSQETSMNVAYSGDFFESPPMWQSTPQAKELMKKLGIGPGLRNGLFTQLTVVDEGAAPVADAEVQLTERSAEIPLPDRTLKTDKAGIVKVPLAPQGMDGHRLKVLVSKPGSYAMPETWSTQDYQAERRITLTSATTIGGVVKLKDGTPLSEAEILVKLPITKPEEKIPEQVIAQVKTDAEGRWKCDGAPKNFEKLVLLVKHTLVRPAEFDSAASSSPANREALLAEKAEFLMAPAPVLQGQVIGSNGKPLPNAEVFIRPSILKSLAGNENQMHMQIQVREEQREEPTTPSTPPIKTDDMGSFSVPWPDEGEVLITVFADEHAPAQAVTSVATGATPLKFSLESGRATAGQLVDYEGKAVSGAEVYLFMLGQHGLPVPKKVATTDNEGRFSWAHAPNKPLTLLFLKEGYAGVLRDLMGTGPAEAKVKIGRGSE